MSRDGPPGERGPQTDEAQFAALDPNVAARPRSILRVTADQRIAALACSTLRKDRPHDPAIERTREHTNENGNDHDKQERDRQYVTPRVPQCGQEHHRVAE